MDVRTVTLARDGQTYVFRYRHGFEGDVADEIARQAADGRSPLDWLGAAMLNFQVAHNAAAACIGPPSCTIQPHN